MSHTSRTLPAGLSGMVGRSITPPPSECFSDEPQQGGEHPEPGAPQRAKSSHKQNARKARKARK